jgi:hypothetical protein
VEVACQRGLTSGGPLYCADIANTARANEPEAAILAALARKGLGGTMTAEALQAETEDDVGSALDRLCQRDLRALRPCSPAPLLPCDFAP